MMAYDEGKFERIKKEIDFDLDRYNLCFADAIEECDNVDDVIEYITYYYEDYLFREDRTAISWIRENDNIVNFYMARGDLKNCSAIWELACEAHYLDAKEKLLTVKDDIQEWIDFYRQSDDDDNDDDDDYDDYDDEY